MSAALQAAVVSARRNSVSVLREGGPSGCHPTDIAYPEGNYLTNKLLSVK